MPQGLYDALPDITSLSVHILLPGWVYINYVVCLCIEVNSNVHFRINCCSQFTFQQSRLEWWLNDMS